MHVLITGGSGFVGRRFVKQLLIDGHSVTVVDPLIIGGGGIAASKWPLFEGVPREKLVVLEMDCREFFSKDKESHRFDLVIHLAAVVGGRLTIENNPMAVAEDLSIDAAFWKWATLVKPEHVISFSSSAAYPVSRQSSLKHQVLSENDISFEGDIGMPDMTYGWAKLTNEYLGILAHEKYGLNVACYRPFSGYGEDQDLTYPFPAICERAIKHTNEEPFVVWGSGNQGRDFIYINDVVNGVLQTYSELKDGHGVNLSTGSLTTFIELAKMVLTYLGKEVDVIGDESMPSGVFARVGSPDRLSALGFVAETEIFEGVARCVDYRKSVVSSEAGEKDV